MRLPIMRLTKLIVLILFLSLSCAAQLKFPDTPAGHQCAAWLEAFNSGDRAAVRAFLEKNSPSRLQYLDGTMNFRQETGGFDLKKLEESSSTKLAVLVQERDSDQMVRLELEVEAAAPHRITQLEFQAVPRPTEFALAHMSENDLIAASRKKLEQEAASDRFSGAAILARNGKSVFAEAYGLADREHKTPNTLKTRFRIGSMNKMFTAVATLQLIQAGKLGLDDPLGKYLSDYPNKELASKVTIQHLLTHTGGTGDIFGPEYRAHRLELRTLQDYVKLCGSRGLQFEPGSQWRYSNYGFVLLGLVIEKVSGQSYYDYVRENVYKLAGMTSTGSEPEDQPDKDRSVGYTHMGGNGWHPNTDTLPYRGTSAGGGYSTVEDLLRFATGLQQNKLLNAHYTELLTTGKVEARDGRYAYGFDDHTMNGTRCFGHGGGAPGMNGDLQICPGSGFVVVVLANMDPESAGRISDFMTNRLPEH